MQKTKKNIHPAAAAAAGIVIGAAAVTAALVHEPTRKMMGKKLNDAKDQVSKTIKDLQKTSESIVKKTHNKAKEASGKETHPAETSMDIDSDYLD